MSTTRTALVTGASSGIGRATAQALHAAGFVTYATARRPDALADLAREGIEVLRLDVTEPRSIDEAVAEIERRHGGLDVLVNNAGYGPLGPVEEFPLDAWRLLFETNVFGLVRVAQAALPGMRRRGTGRLINVGSMGGEFTSALGGAYHASKYSVEALSDALRVEVRPFGVRVVIIQPGPVRTPMAHAAADIRAADGSVYGPAIEHMAQSAVALIQRGRGIESPETVAQVIVKAAQARRPKARYKVGPVAHLLPFLRRWLPLSWWDAMQLRQAGLNKIQPSGTDSTGAAAPDSAPSAPGTTRPLAS